MYKRQSLETVEAMKYLISPSILLTVWLLLISETSVVDSSKSVIVLSSEPTEQNEINKESNVKKDFFIFVGDTRFELVTPCVSSKCSAGLS